MLRFERRLNEVSARVLLVILLWIVYTIVKCSRSVRRGGGSLRKFTAIEWLLMIRSHTSNLTWWMWDEIPTATHEVLVLISYRVGRAPDKMNE